jgi:hypothetical protein
LNTRNDEGNEKGISKFCGSILPAPWLQQMNNVSLIRTGVAIDVVADSGLGTFTTDEAAIAAICDALVSCEIAFNEFVSTLA